MKFKFLIIFISFFSCLVTNSKRIAPKLVKPVIHNGLKYEVPHWSSGNMKHNGGYIRVINAKDNIPICTKEVYENNYNPELESDVQDRFITSIKVVGKNLVIHSETSALIEKSLENFCD